jgi:hypothetical protein
MSQQQKAEPPSWLRPPIFMIGQDSRGNWVVKDQTGVTGGLFVERDEALRFVRSENRIHPHALVMVSDVLELDLGRPPSPAPQRQMTAATPRERQVA